MRTQRRFGMAVLGVAALAVMTAVGGAIDGPISGQIIQIERPLAGGISRPSRQHKAGSRPHPGEQRHQPRASRRFDPPSAALPSSGIGRSVTS